MTRKVIYEPKGKAGEYAPLALNLGKPYYLKKDLIEAAA